MKFLEVIEVSKQYYKHTALDKVTIDVNEGTIFGLLGPNGAGKTTLIRIITQIISPDEGKVLFQGKEWREEMIKDIGYLPEERGLYKKVKVFDQLLYLAQLKGLERYSAIQKIEWWLNHLQIDQWKNKNIEDLSKGMQQKIQFIATILHQPKLMILDEPFSGFDPVNAEIIKKEILNFKNEGRTIILSTHNMNSVEELCDDIALIHQSKVVLKGSVYNIKKQFKSNVYQICFKGNLQAFTHALWASAELIDFKEVHNEWVVRIKLLQNASINQILLQILPICEIVYVKEEELSMNDIFIKTVSQNSDIQVQSTLTE